VRKLVVVAGVACLALLGLATPAFAHNALVSSTPAAESTVDATPATVTLTFDQPVQKGNGLNTVSVRGPGDTGWKTGTVDVQSNIVTASLDELGPAGGYKITYRIVSADGHPVSGEVPFTLSKEGNGTATATGPAENDGGGLPLWVWIAGAVVVLGVGLTVALRIGGKQPQ
jgi:methionine-rich copper-binding protein CopC